MLNINTLSLFICTISLLLLGIFHFNDKAELVALERFYGAQEVNLKNLDMLNSNQLVDFKVEKKNYNFVGKYCSEAIRELSFEFKENGQFFIVKRNASLEGRYQRNEKGEIAIKSETELEFDRVKPYLVSKSKDKNGKKNIMSIYIGNIVLSRLYCRS